MEYVILGLLMTNNLTLYQLNKAFERGISLFYSASSGSLQFALKKLSIQGFVTFEEKTENGRNKKIYAITGKGKDFFIRWMMAEVPLNKLETTALTKLYFLGLIDSQKNKKHILSGIIDKIREAEKRLDELNKSLSQYTIPKSCESIFHYQVKSLDYGIKVHLFSRKWFTEVLAELENSSK